MIRVGRDPDFADRIEQQLDALRSRFQHGNVLEAFRGAHASLHPSDVASWLVAEACEWISAPCWAVVTRDSRGKLVVLSEQGLTPAAGPAMWKAAEWVIAHGCEMFSGDLCTDSRVAGKVSGTVLAMPLTCRGRTVGVLVGVDPEPSGRHTVSRDVLTSLSELLELPAIALDNALTVQRAKALSVTDDLTNLFNLRYLNQVLRREIKRSSRTARPLSLLFIDLDGFKRVNDQHGHLAGSRALVQTAGILTSCARETDVVARFGGDEFSIVLPDTAVSGAMAVATRIRDRIRAFDFETPEGPALRLTASIGVATMPGVAGTAEELIRAADLAMYKVKDAGKDGIHVAKE